MGQVSLYIPDELHERAKKFAETSRISLSKLVSNLIADYLEENSENKYEKLESQIKDVNDEIEELRKELLMVKASVQQLLSERE